MGRRRTTKEIPAAEAPRPPGVPPQRGGVDVWPILAEPAIAAAEVAIGAHDDCLRLLLSLATSQGIATVSDACMARLRHLEG